MDTWELIVILFAAIIIVVLIYLFVLSKKTTEEKKIEQKPSIQPAPETEKIAVQPSSPAEVPTEQVQTAQEDLSITPPQIHQETSIVTHETTELITTAVKGEPSKEVEEIPKPEQVLPTHEDLTVTPPEIRQEPPTVRQEIAAPITAVVKEELSKEVEVTPKQEPSGTPEEEKKTPRRRGRPKGSGKKKPQPVENPTV